MATINGYTAERMKEIEDNTIVSGEVVDDELILVKYNSETVNAGYVRGPQGEPGIVTFEDSIVIPSGKNISSTTGGLILNGDGKATLNKVVSLKDDATSTEWLNSAGTGILQGTGELSPGRIKINSDNGASPTDVNPPFEIKSIANDQALRFDFNDIQARNGTNGNTLSLNRFGGDVILGNSSSTLGISGTINAGTLKDSATSTEWLNAAGTGRLQTPVMLVASRNSTAYSIATGGEKAFDTTHHNIILNTGGFTRSSVSGVARYFVPTNGYYRIIYTAGFEENTNGQRYIAVYSSSGSVTFNSTEAVSNLRTYLNCQAVYYLTTTDYLHFAIHQSSGGSLGMSVDPRGGQIIIEHISN